MLPFRALRRHGAVQFCYRDHGASLPDWRSCVPPSEGVTSRRARTIEVYPEDVSRRRLPASPSRAIDARGADVRSRRRSSESPANNDSRQPSRRDYRTAAVATRRRIALHQDDPSAGLLVARAARASSNVTANFRHRQLQRPSTNRRQRIPSGIGHDRSGSGYSEPGKRETIMTLRRQTDNAVNDRKKETAPCCASLLLSCRLVQFLLMNQPARKRTLPAGNN